MEHQDWKQIVFTKENKYTNEQIKNYEIKKKEILLKKKEKENDIIKPLKINYDLKKSIMQARINNKMSQKDLANKLNVSINVINGYENGKIIPNNQFIVRIEKILNCKLPHIKKNK